MRIAIFESEKCNSTGVFMMNMKFIYITERSIIFRCFKKILERGCYPYIRFVKEVMSRKWYIFKKLLSIEKITIVESNNGEIERKTGYKQEL